jgi:hypothetical protein
MLNLVGQEISYLFQLLKVQLRQDLKNCLQQGLPDEFISKRNIPNGVNFKWI